jgi:hypothetical protein
MALPPIDVNEDLEADTEAEPMDDLEDEAMPEDMPSDVDPMFAADVAEAFPDLDDAQMAALQRAVLGLIASGGGMGGGAPPAPPMGF